MQNIQRTVAAGMFHSRFFDLFLLYLNISPEAGLSEGAVYQEPKISLLSTFYTTYHCCCFIIKQ